MKKFLTKLVFQLDKPFYVWALVAGPAWAQNIAFFAIWVYIVLLLAMCVINAGKKKEVHELMEVPGNKEEMERWLEPKYTWLWTIPSLCVAVAAASQAWFVSAFFYALFILLSLGSAIDLKDKKR